MKMARTYPPFVESLKTTDPELFEVVSKNFDLAYAPGELDTKTKNLIVLALDILALSPEGVKSVATRARSMGVTEGEIKEVIRLVYMVAPNRPLGTSRNAY